MAQSRGKRHLERFPQYLSSRDTLWLRSANVYYTVRVAAGLGADAAIALSRHHLGPLSELRDREKPSRLPLLGGGSCHSNVVTSRNMRYGLRNPGRLKAPLRR